MQKTGTNSAEEVMCASQWTVGQLVSVEPRTWAGINRPGGVAKITKLHYSSGFVESVDVKYVIGAGVDTKLDLDFVEPHEELQRGGRARRGRELYRASPAKRVRSFSNANDSVGNTNTRKPKLKKNDENDDPKQKSSSSRAQQRADEKTTSENRSVKAKVNTDTKATSEKGNVKVEIKADATSAKKKKPAATSFRKPSTCDNDPNKRKAAHGNTKTGEHKVVFRLSAPCSNVVLDEKVNVSPLADTPEELRRKKGKKKTMLSSSRSKANKQQPTTVVSRSTTEEAPASAKRALAIQPTATPAVTCSAKSGPSGQLKQASGIKDSLESKRTIVLGVPASSLRVPMAPDSRDDEARPNQVPLKQIYDKQVVVANDFVQGIVGKPQAAPFVKAPVERSNSANKE